VLSGQLHAPGALPPRDPLDRRLGVCPTSGVDDVVKRKFFPLPGLELRPLGHPARNQSLYRHSHSGSKSYPARKIKTKKPQKVDNELNNCAEETSRTKATIRHFSSICSYVHQILSEDVHTHVMSSQPGRKYTWSSTYDRLPSLSRSGRMPAIYRLRHKSVNRCTFCRWSYFR
jgi:hypothetical protein